MKKWRHKPEVKPEAKEPEWKTEYVKKVLAKGQEVSDLLLEPTLKRTPLRFEPITLEKPKPKGLLSQWI